jgi:succinate dehydrogenase / fumarate reductase cytochrome b subunit
MYKGQLGMLSWLLHRITGLAILLFLLIHIVDISILGFGRAAYNESILFFDQIVVRFLSLALIGAVLLHGFNGIRIMFIDFWRKGAKYQKAMFVAVIVVTLLCFIPATYYVIGPFFVPWLFHIPGQGQAVK